MFDKLRQKFRAHRETARINNHINDLANRLLDNHPNTPRGAVGQCDVVFHNQTEFNSIDQRFLKVGPYYVGTTFDHEVMVQVVNDPSSIVTIYRNGFLHSGIWEEKLAEVLQTELHVLSLTGTREEVYEAKSVKDAAAANEALTEYHANN